MSVIGWFLITWDCCLRSNEKCAKTGTCWQSRVTRNTLNQHQNEYILDAMMWAKNSRLHCMAPFSSRDMAYFLSSISRYIFQMLCISLLPHAFKTELFSWHYFWLVSNYYSIYFPIRKVDSKDFFTRALRGVSCAQATSGLAIMALIASRFFFVFGTRLIRLNNLSDLMISWWLYFSYFSQKSILPG